ncbi:DUF305 domain-containing protein [Planosporangium mesophilum]|uniref:DUF305 domain-containing protein n=1 Tax=Planosporangium mesophilum TaxID=689768 RepID=A0A8J3T859_9ACTN|nr:DUF305 domain-containing protein [Planosporangium mesophilum]NJC81506.1 DUF305 domain-containing protein [Planosporangium mesophilum]GII20836.1 DUF305 domain-containing protein [Planosporangium mesophilum]
MSAAIVPSSRRVRLLLAGLAAVAVLLLTYASGVVSAGLYSPGDNSPEAGFVRDMSLHHAQAVEMGMLAYQKATDPEVRKEGYDIALTQENQRGMMKAWLDKWHVSRTSINPPMSWMPGGSAMMSQDGRMPGMASDEELTKLNTATGKDFDILFCQLMTRHHLGGIHMADEILKQSDNPDILMLVQSMKSGQQNEINIFNSILARLGAKPTQ